MTAPLIRGAVPGDERGFRSLIARIRTRAGDGAAWGPDLDDIREAAVALDGGRVVGAAWAWRNGLHPGRVRLALGVDPGWRRRGLGRNLWAALATTGAATSDAPASCQYQPASWQCQVDSLNLAGRTFLAGLGFEAWMRTRIGEIGPGGPPPEPDRRLPDGWTLVPLADAPPALRERGLLAALHGEVYRRQHGWDPPRAIGAAEARALFVDDPDDPLDDPLAVLAMSGDRPAGVASLRRLTSADRPVEGRFGLGWCGTVVDGPADDLVSGAMATWCLGLASRLGATVEVEVDDTHGATIRTCESAGVVWTREWLTVVRHGEPSRS